MTSSILGDIVNICQLLAEYIQYQNISPIYLIPEYIQYQYTYIYSTIHILPNCWQYISNSICHQQIFRGPICRQGAQSAGARFAGAQSAGAQFAGAQFAIDKISGAQYAGAQFAGARFAIN